MSKAKVYVIICIGTTKITFIGVNVKLLKLGRGFLVPACFECDWIGRANVEITYFMCLCVCEQDDKSGDYFKEYFLMLCYGEGVFVLLEFKRDSSP